MGIDVLVPVLGRPDFKEPLAESLSVTVTPYRLIFICNRNRMEDIAACEPFGEVLIAPWLPGRADFARKINLGFRESENEWIFQGADDIRFSAGWDTAALQTAAKTGRSVIGTNDLHNPAVQRGRHSTHTLFARSYIEEFGGTQDNTGIVFCELYDHQFVDTEFIEVARRRRQWAFSRDSIVEHFHPHWGNARMDPTYRKALRNTMHDMRLYRRRMGLQAREQRHRRSTRPRA